MFRSLRARYYIVVVGVATIPILLLGLSAGLRSAAELERKSLDFQTELATRVEREITFFISSRINELQVLEQTNVLANADQTQLSASLGRLLAHDQVYQELLVLTPTGQVQAFASRTDVKPREKPHWLGRAFAQPGYWDGQDIFVGPVEFDIDLREPLIEIAVPILRRRSGEVAGVLLAHARFKPIWDLLADLDLSEDTDAFVVNADGRILAHPSPGEVLSASIFDVPAEGGRHRLADGRSLIVVKRALSLVSTPTFVIVTRPLTSALASAVEIRTTTLISALVLLLGASALALWQSRSIVRPVEELAKGARQISAGDLVTRIEVSGPAEINALGQTLQEMTDQLKQTIADLKRSEFAERQRAMVTLQSIGDAVITTDRNGRVTYINPVAERLTGWRLEDALDRPVPEVFNIVDETTRSPVPNRVERCLESGRIVGLANHTALLSRDGREYAISDSAAPIRESNGDVIGVVMVFQDVTEQRALEQAMRQSQKMDAIGQLSGGIAHDFNNLLQVIRGNAELLADDPDLDPDLTRPILQATERGAELTQRLLAYARKQPLMPRTIDTSRLFSDLLPMLDRTLGETIEVSLESEDQVWLVACDPGQLETAILNLALNARDAMPNGGSLTIRCAKATKDDFRERHRGDLGETDFVRITVSDTGLGMTEETRMKAFDPFYTTKGVGEGSGLGLSMVYGFVMQTGGHLEIDSAQGAGTTVTMFLPRSRAVPGPGDTAEAPELPKGNGETILVVEDDAEVRVFAKKALETLGYQVVDVGNAADAREALAGLRGFELVLTDVVLPGGASGFDLARELARDRPDLPVVMMSGYPETVVSHSDVDGQTFVLLDKPFRRARLAKTVRHMLDQRRSRPSS